MNVSTDSSSTSDRKRKRSNRIIIGTDDFDKIIRKKGVFIDKTLFIEEWMEDAADVSVILRPRRFGKSTNLSMLKSFFSFNTKSEDFERFLIGQEKEFIKEHCGKYPVVLLNMKGIGGESWEEMLSKIWSCMKEIVEYHRDHLTEEDIKFIEIDCYDTKVQPNETVAAAFVRRLTRRLYKKYNKQVIVLIDEYDAPLNHAFRSGSYDEAANFFGEFYSNGFLNL